MLCLPLILLIFVVPLREVRAVFYNGTRRDVHHGSCRHRMIRQIADPPVGPTSTESFVLDYIEYKLCRYHVTWDEALVFCSSHKAHLATLDTEEKTAFVVQAIASSSTVAEDYWIGARKYRGSWTWHSNRKKLSTAGAVIGNVPIRYPGYEPNDVYCLTIDRSGHDVSIFIPRACNQQRPFICQRDNEPTFDNKIRMVAALRIGEHEFRLYSGRATWAEAVVQCRQEGLQIGEVNTVEEARALAVSMLRNRPEGIESAWIGGYTRKDDPSTWRWLASGEKIENNEMWRKNLTEFSGGCLLLDRHVCESPIYVETMCDRKRDVLCQKPPKKRVSKYPVAVFVDGCPYWIGLYPRKWSSAKRACDALNASLVVLDSPKTIAHMMSLMIDNRAVLRHIWTDGRRADNGGRWHWDSTGEEIPDPSKSFIPWCSDDGFYSNETDCLNLDRENLDSPIVYGLSCHEKQSYVCQPRIGDCVYHSTPTTISASSDATEDISNAAVLFTLPFYHDSGHLSLSKVTAPYPMNNDHYGAIQTIIDGENNMTDLLHGKPGVSVSGKKASTVHTNLTQYLKPLSRFTLPSLPQFGIKVVSAADATFSSRPIFESKRKKLKTQSMSTSLSVVTPSILAPTVLPNFTMGRKNPIDTYRKAMRWPANATKVSITSNLSGNIETTVSSVPMISTSPKIFYKIPNVSNINQPSLGSKNSVSKFTNVVRITTTLPSLLPEEPPLTSTLEDERAKKYSVKTTRDLNTSNSTIIASTITTTIKTPDTMKIKPTHSFQRPSGDSALKDFKDIQPKPVVVESFPVNAARPNTTVMSRRKLIYRTTTTEATPYDAIDADYYNNYEAPEESSKGKETTDDETKDNGPTLNEYSEDYETVTPRKSLTKKKTKISSTANSRKSQTTMKSLRRTKISKTPEVDEEIDENDDETAEDTEDNDERTTAASEQTIPIAAQLSKNLEAALVNMMRQGVERRKNEKAEDAVTSKSAGQRESNVSYGERSMKGLKTINTENWLLRPYYGFEGPMVVGLSEDSNVGGDIEKTGEKGGGRIRQFKFTGKQINDNPSLKAIETGKFIANETRRQMKNHADSTSNRNPGNIMSGVSMPGLPMIQPNDPNSLVQLGRYFKNKFAGFESNGRENAERIGSEDRGSSVANNMREDRLTSDQRRFGIYGPNAHQRMRYRPRPGGRENESRRKGHPGAWEKQRRPPPETDVNYYEGRRLYPRGYDFSASSMPRQFERRNEERWREEQDRLHVAWPEKKWSNSELPLGLDEQSQVVSPRTFPAPIRTTRSFHDDPTIDRDESPKIKSFPDFRLSKLVKEVKIDLDQRLLRKYLEGFARKIVKKDTAKEDNWKTTWRQLLGEMMTVLDRMNINVNGDLMKLRVGKNERENKLTPSSSVEHSRTLDWKSGLRKQRKDSINRGTLKQFSNPVAKKINDSVTARDRKVSSDDGNHRLSPNSLQDKDSAKTKNSNLRDEQTTDSYGRYAYDEEKLIGRKKNNGRPPQSALPVLNVLTAKNAQNGDDSIYDRKFVDNSPKTSSHREERTAKPIVDHQFSPRQIVNDPQRTNWFQPKYTNLNNSRIVLAPPASMIPQLSTVFGYQPVIPQLHHRILFPGWTGIRVLDRINAATDKSAVFKGEYLPKGILSRIVGSEHKKEHFGDRSDQPGNSQRKYDLSASTTTTSGLDHKNNGLTSSVDGTLNWKIENESSKKNNLVANNPVEKRPGNAKIVAWRRVGGEVGRNEVRNEDSSRYYNNESYINESDIRKTESNRGDILESGALGVDYVTDEDIIRHEDYEQKPVWSPAHHLTKALELSLLRKFGTNPSNSLRSKNLVARSTKNSEAERDETYGDGVFARRHHIEEDLERLNDEPSTFSLRMIMDPDKKASPRTLRRPEDSRVLERKPRTIELQLQFTGKEDTTNTVTRRINEVNAISIEDQRNSQYNRTFGDSSITGQGSNLRSTKKRPFGFLDKDRRRALMNRLRERSRNFHLNNRRSFPRHGENRSVVNNSRDRKSRTIMSGGKNMPNYENSSKDYPDVKHHIATVIRSLEEKNISGKEQDNWRRTGIYGKEFGVDWTGQAASLFTDLKETSDEFTLYIDLTLGRVGNCLGIPSQWSNIPTELLRW